MIGSSGFRAGRGAYYPIWDASRCTAVPPLDRGGHIMLWQLAYLIVVVAMVILLLRLVGVAL